MKKFLSIVLAAVMMLLLVPMSILGVSAETVTDEQGLEYALSSDGTYYIVMDYTRTAAEVVIPEEFNGLPVKELDSYALYWDSDIQSVKIPASVTIIGHSTLHACPNLKTIEVAEGNPVFHSSGNCLIETETKTLVVGCNNSVIPSDGSVTSIGGSAFYYCSGLVSIEIPEAVTSIGSSAFGMCRDLTDVSIPDTLTWIGSSAFSLPYSEYSIYDCAAYLGTSNNPYFALIRAFDDDDVNAITSCDIHPDTKIIAGAAFDRCANFTSVSILDSVISICNSAFNGCSGLTSITIPDSVTSIGYEAFYGCSSLTSITLPDSIESIDSHTFSECSALSSITIPDSVTSIGYEAFCGCSSLTSITLPDSVRSIGEWAFCGCSGLTSITLPDSIESIGSYTFSKCSALSSITIPDSVTNIGDGAFYKCTSLKTVIIGNSVAIIGLAPFILCSSLENITVESGNTVYHSSGNCLIETETKTLILGGKNSVIPVDGSVTSIDSSAFQGHSGITRIIIPDSVESIEAYAFGECTSLTDIYCEAEAQPEGWDADWNINCDATVHWGYTSEVAAGDLENGISETETNLIESDYAEVEWNNIQEALNNAKEFETDGKSVAEIRSAIDALESTILLNPKKAEFGDLDGDTKISASDYLFAKRACFNTFDLTDAQNARADLNRDNKVDSADYVSIKRIAFGTYKV